MLDGTVFAGNKFYENLIDEEGLLDALLRLNAKHPGVISLFSSPESDNPYGVSMVHLAVVMLVYHACKDAQYGKSWSKRGESGIFHNFMRKEDRLEQLSLVAMLSEGVDSHEARVALIDTLLDSALYGMMWVSFAAKSDPASFRAWLRRQWSPTTSIAFEDIMDLLDPDWRCGDDTE